MLTLKKLLPAPFFLVSFIYLLHLLNPLFNTYDFIFSLSLDTLIQLLILSAVILLTSFFFVLFVGLANDWRFVLPVGILASLFPMFLMNQDIGLIFTVGTAVIWLLIFLSLENTLKGYLNFAPASIFGPSIRHLASFLIVLIAIIYFLSINRVISQKGFQIPDSLIDTAIKLSSGATTETQITQQNPTTQSAISPQQLELLKKNPQLLKQYGLDPSVLNNLNQSSTSPNSSVTGSDVIKNILKDQFNNLIKPYIGAIPALLAVLFFFILQSLTTILNLLIYPLLWIIFYTLEKTKFITFTEEQRPVKKMVV